MGRFDRLPLNRELEEIRLNVVTLVELTHCCLPGMVERRRGVVMNVPESERRDIMLKVRRSTERVVAKATEARADVTGRLSELRRGQAAAKAYEMR